MSIYSFLKAYTSNITFSKSQTDFTPMDYYIYTYNNENVDYYGFGYNVPQYIYDDDYYMLNEWNKLPEENSIKIGILYNPFDVNLNIDNFYMLNILLYSIMNQNVNSKYTLRPYLVYDENHFSCRSMLKYLINLNVSYIFGGLSSECRIDIINYFNDYSDLDTIVFYTGEIDYYECNKNIIEMGPTPSQLFQLMLLKMYEINASFIIIKSNKYKYPQRVSEIFYSRLIEYGFSVLVIDINEINNYNNIFSEYVNFYPTVLVTLNKYEDIVKLNIYINKFDIFFHLAKYVYFRVGNLIINRFYSENIGYSFPDNSYFVNHFFDNLLRLSTEQNSFNVEINHAIINLINSMLGDNIIIPSTSEKAYCAIDIFKSVIDKINPTSPKRIRLSLYNSGYFSTTGSIIIDQSNYIPRRMYLGKLNFDTHSIDVINSPSSTFSPYWNSHITELCDCTTSCKNFTEIENFYEILIVYNLRDVNSSIILSSVALSIISSNTDSIDKSYPIVILPVCLKDENSDNLNNKLNNKHVVGIIGLNLEYLLPIAEERKIPFYYLGYYVPKESTYTFFVGLNINTAVISLINYMEDLSISLLVIVQQKYEYENNNDTYIIKKIKEAIKNYNSSVVILKDFLIDNINPHYDIFEVITYLENNKRNLIGIFLLNLVANFLIGYNSNAFVNAFYNSQIQTDITTIAFISFNYYDYYENIIDLLQGNIAIRLFAPDKTSTESIGFQFQLENLYGSDHQISDLFMSILYSYSCIEYALKEISKINIEPGRTISEYVRILSYNYNYDGSIKYKIMDYNNILSETIILTEINEVSSFKVIREYTYSDNEKYYNYGPIDKLYEYNINIKTILILLMIIFIFLELFTIFFVYKHHDNKNFRGDNLIQFSALIVVNTLISLIPCLFFIQLSDVMCYIRYYSAVILNILFYLILYNRSYILYKIASNKTIFRVNFSITKRIMLIIIPLIICIILSIIWKTIFNLKCHKELYYSTLFENIYVLYCDDDHKNYGSDIVISAIFIGIGFTIAWYSRFISNGLGSSSIFIINAYNSVMFIVYIPIAYLIPSFQKEIYQINIFLEILLSYILWFSTQFRILYIFI